MHTTPRFLQGVFAFEGQGLQKPSLLHPSLTYVVPQGVTAQPLYFRGGQSSEEMMYVVLLRDGAPMRWFPMGAKDSVNIPLRIVEDMLGDTRLELHVAAPEGLTGEVVVDFGLVEV